MNNIRIEIQEALDNLDVDNMDGGKKALISFITANFVRLSNNPNADTARSMMMLLAALSILSGNDDSSSLGAAKRLATAAFGTKQIKTKFS